MINSVYEINSGNFQFCLNSVYVRLINNGEDFLKYTSKPTYITNKIFGKDYAALHEIKPVLILNEPIYVEFTVLDLSKWKMYDCHYNFIKKNFDAELLFTVTGSLTYEIKSENVYEEFFKWKDLFDFSNYSKDSKFFDETNKKVTGKMKDEFGGVTVIEFVGLKSNMYSMMVKNVIQEKEWMLWFNVTNLKMFYSIKKWLDTKWKEFKGKGIN